LPLGASLALLPGVGLEKILEQRRNSRQTLRLGLAPNAKDSTGETWPTLINSSSYSFQRATRTLVVSRPNSKSKSFGHLPLVYQHDHKGGIRSFLRSLRFEGRCSSIIDRDEGGTSFVAISDCRSSATSESSTLFQLEQLVSSRRIHPTDIMPYWHLGQQATTTTTPTVIYIPASSPSPTPDGEGREKSRAPLG
jgi:hypothetical protein